MPTDLCSGDRTTVHHLLRFLKERHEVVFCVPVSNAKVAAQNDLVAPYCEQVETFPLPRWKSLLQCCQALFRDVPLQVRYFGSDELDSRLRAMVAAGEVDVVYGYHLRSAQYLAGLPCPKVLDLKPVQSLNLRRMKEYVSSFLRRKLYDFEYQRVARYEPHVASEMDACLVASKKDREELSSLPNVVVNPHGLDVNYFAPDPNLAREPRHLVFSGRMGYDPNHDAILYFCRSILPRVRESIPDVKLTVVGRDPHPELVRLGTDPNIHVTGFVDDLRPYLNRAQVAINPLRVGAGMQNKVIEAMAMELPMVVTPVANEGIRATPEEHLIVRETPETFADAVIELLQDPDRCRQMGSAARDYVVREWSWEKHFLDLEAILVELVNQRDALDGSMDVERPMPAAETSQSDRSNAGTRT